MALKEAGGLAAEQAGQSAFPFRRVVLWVTLFFFGICLFAGILLSFQERSLEPLLSQILKPVAADYDLGRLVSVVASGGTPVFEGLFYRSTPAWLWFWTKFFFTLVVDVYFIFFFAWMIYLFFEWMDNASAMRNFLLMLVTYVIITFLLSTMLFVADNNGRVLPDGRMNAVRSWFFSSVPFQGLTKAVLFFVRPELVIRVNDWVQTSPVAGVVTSVYQGNSSVDYLANGSGV